MFRSRFSPESHAHHESYHCTPELPPLRRSVTLITPLTMMQVTPKVNTGNQHNRRTTYIYIGLVDRPL
ncbi:hypothetical protein BJV78DRAFT_1257758 [Lactifluus subvellereus]|nr:hypothetical protein BJV78DRAFT_1257758 [Lactifluus subvellereus]